MVVSGDLGEVGTRHAGRLPIRLQKPMDGAAALGMLKREDVTVEDDAIEAAIAELNGVLMVTLEAVHGGPPWGVCLSTRVRSTLFSQRPLS
jgi:hypothetical protein